MMKSSELNRFYTKIPRGWPGHNLGNQNSCGCAPCLIWFSSAIREFILGEAGPVPTRGGLDEAGDLRIALVRILRPFSCTFEKPSPQIPYRSEAVPLMNHWEPSTRRASGFRMSSPPLASCSEACHDAFRPQCPMIHLEGEGPKAPTYWPLTGTWPSETHRSLHNTTTEVCVLNEEGELVGGIANEEEAWASPTVCFQNWCEGNRVNGFKHPPSLMRSMPLDKNKPARQALQRRQEEQQRHLERLKAKLESMDDDDVRKSRFETACRQVEIALEDRETQISELLQMSHRLTVIGKFRLG